MDNYIALKSLDLPRLVARNFESSAIVNFESIDGSGFHYHTGSIRNIDPELLRSPKLQANIQFVDHPFSAYISITFTAIWDEPTLPAEHRLVQIPVEIRLPPDAITEDPVFTTINIENGDIAALEEKFWRMLPEISPEDLRWILEEPSVSMVEFNTNPEKIIGKNFFSHQDVGPFSNDVELLRECLQKSACRITVIFVDEQTLVNDIKQKFTTARSKQLSIDGARFWWRWNFLSKPSWPSLTDALPSDERETYDDELPAQSVFVTPLQWITTQAYRAFVGAEAAQAKTQRSKDTVRFIDMLHGNNNVLVASFANTRAKNNETMKMQLKESQNIEEWWTVKFTDKVPALAACNSLAFVERPYLEMYKRYEDTQIPEKHRVKFSASRSNEDSAKALSECIGLRITLYPKPDPIRQYARVIDMLRWYWQHREKLGMLTKLVLGGNLRDLPLFDLFEREAQRISQGDILEGRQLVDTAVGCAINGLGETQVKAFRSLAAMPGYLQIINGIGGAGKSEFIVRICGFLYTIASGQKAGPAHVMSHSNKTVDRLARNIWNHLHDLYATNPGKYLYPIVIRRHSDEAEEEMSRKQATIARNHGKPQIDGLEPPSDETLANLQNKIRSSQLMMYQDYQDKQRTQKEGVRDARLQEKDLSLGQLVLQIAGYPRPDGTMHPRALTSRDSRDIGIFRHYTDTFADKQRLDDDDMMKWDLAYKAVCLIIVRMADAIVETGQNYLETDNHRGWTPRINIFDESAKEREAEVIGTMAYAVNISGNTPIYAPTILLGDVQQPKPINGSRSRDDDDGQEPFKHQESLSFFTRLIMNGASTLHFRHQYRYVKDIADLLAICGYVGITCDESIEKRTEAQLATKAWKRLFKVDKRIFALCDATSEQVVDPKTKSLGNRRHVELAYLVLAMLESEGIPANKVAIVTPYNLDFAMLVSMKQAALDFYNSKNDKRFKKWAANLEGLTLTTLDSLQGGEADYVILSLPNTKTLGFLKENARINMAISRARYGLIIITNYARLSSRNSYNKEFKNSAYSRVMRSLSTDKLIANIDKVPDDKKARWTCPFAEQWTFDLDKHRPADAAATTLEPVKEPPTFQDPYAL